MRITTDPKEIRRRMVAWEKYIEGVPKKIQALAEETKAAAVAPERMTAEVAVVGGGGSGTAAALEAAAAGAKAVLVLDLFEGGGSTRRSGGVVYAGGGTSVQQRLGIKDTAEGMAAYLKKEVDGAVGDDVVERFCAESPGLLRWLNEHCGVDFSGELYDTKSSYPPSTASLYLSGNEKAYPYSTTGIPAPRGHRPLGDGLTGNVLWAGLEAAVERTPAIVARKHCRCERLLSEGGRVVGVAGRTLPEGAHALHTMLGEIGAMSSLLGATFVKNTGADAPPPLWRRCVAQQHAVWEALGHGFEARASQGVVLAAGGFGFNADMVQQHCPKYWGLCPLGNLGDQGSGIQMGMDVGAASALLDRGSAWKFINPPVSFAKGIMLDPSGKRIRNEDCYGATLADIYVQNFGGKAWLLIDQSMVEEAMAQLPALNPDQSGVAMGNLFKNREQEATLPELATACGMDPAHLEASAAAYNLGCANGVDAMNKQSQYLGEIKTGPFTAINMDVRSKWWPTPMMTLGGLRVEGATGQVLDGAGSRIPGLFAAGRNAVGVCSNSYVSGLSIGDALFSGRRAGRSVMATAATAPSKGNLVMATAASKL